MDRPERVCAYGSQGHFASVDLGLSATFDVHTALRRIAVQTGFQAACNGNQLELEELSAARWHRLKDRL